MKLLEHLMMSQCRHNNKKNSNSEYTAKTQIKKKKADISYSIANNLTP